MKLCLHCIRVSTYSLHDCLIITKNINGLSNKLSQVHLSAMAETDLKEALKIFVSDSYKLEPRLLIVYTMCVHFFLDQFRNDFIFLQPQWTF